MGSRTLFLLSALACVPGSRALAGTAAESRRLVTIPGLDEAATFVVRRAPDGAEVARLEAGPSRRADSWWSFPISTRAPSFELARE